MYSVERGPWRIRDHFGDEWVISLPSFAEQRPAPGGRPTFEQSQVVEELVFQAFTHMGAWDDELASVLLKVYDEFANETLSEQLPQPSDDPQRLLVGFEEQIRPVLVNAVADDRVRIEKAERQPWPFTDVEEEAPASLGPAPVEEKTTFIAIELLDQNGKAVPNRRYRISLASGRILREGRLDNKGSARVDGLDPAMCVVTFPDVDSGAAATGISSGSGDAPPPGPDSLTWVAFQLTGSATRYSGLAYELTTPDGTVRAGNVDASGLIRVDGVPLGLCQLRFPDKGVGEVTKGSEGT